jgi:hypothetical protein
MDSPETAASGETIPHEAPLARIEHAIQALDIGEEADNLDERIRAGIEEAGGIMLFCLSAAGAGQGRWTAAIALEREEGQELAILAIGDDGAVSIEPVDDSPSPVAAIARSYAGLAEHWGKAAA